MRTRRLLCFTLIVCFGILSSVAHAHTAKQSSRHAESASARQRVATSIKGKHTRNILGKKKWRQRGQQAIAPQRVREIQAALIRENYLSGAANGVWDQRSKSAMARFQADNHWQSKVVPDSRALIKLGLGPDHAGLLNPDTAAIGFIPGGGTPTSPSLSQR